MAEARECGALCRERHAYCTICVLLHTYYTCIIQQYEDRYHSYRCIPVLVLICICDGGAKNYRTMYCYMCVLVLLYVSLYYFVYVSAY